MGVLRCDRIQCDNIMCEINIEVGNNRHGIDICNECADEFINYRVAHHTSNDDEIKSALVLFMQTPKTPRIYQNIVKDFFKRNNTRPNLFEEE